MSGRRRTLWQAFSDTYRGTGFSMAGAVAFALLVSLFPFCIFLGALAGQLGGPELTQPALDQLFKLLPVPVAVVLTPEVRAVVGSSRPELLTVGGLLAFFFATNALESLRAALNEAYRVTETRSYLKCYAQSALFVLVTALSLIVLASVLIRGSEVAEVWQPDMLRDLMDKRWFASLVSGGAVLLVLLAQLVAYHVWLAAGQQGLLRVLPGAVLSTVLIMIAGKLYGFYLAFSDLSQFYAGLSQLMGALVFFQVVAFLIILGAELNRGLRELSTNAVVADADQAGDVDAAFRA